MEKFLVFMLSTIALFSVAGNNPGIPEFGDDFNVSGTFIENWKITKGVKCEGGRVIILPNNNIVLRRIPQGNFAFTADLTVQKPKGKKIGHCGMIIDGIHFMITPKSRPIANTAYRLPGEKRSRGRSIGNIPGFKFGSPCQIMISRQKLGKGYKYSYKVNGNPVDSFQVVKPSDGKIKFYGYKTNITVDNFQLYKLKESDGSNNLAINSSFEYLQEGRPNYMRPLMRGKYKFAGKWEDFLKKFAIDTNEKVSGNNSARMTCGKEYPKSNGVATYNVSVMAKTPVTFSIYLKASKDNFPATLNIWELHHKNHAKRIKLSKKWKRYVFTVKNPERSIVRGSVIFNKPGTVWADDIQVEIGSKTTKYMASSLDKDKYADGTKEKMLIEEDIILKKAKKTPVIDGYIEDIWFKDGAKIDKFFFKGGNKPKNKTVAYLTCDDANLYLAVRAYVPDTAKVKGTKEKRDVLRIHGQDCIEVLLDTTFGRKNYHHLTTNSAGSKTDMGPSRILAWNGKWEAVAKVNKKEKSIDYEMKFPLEIFSGLDIAGKWGLNIGRNDTDSKKVYSLTHTKEVNFHLPTIFPAIVFPDGIVDKYKVGFKDLFLVSDKDSKFSMSGTVGNMSGKALNATIRIINGATGKVIGKKNIKLKRGNMEVSVPVNGVRNVKAMDCILKIFVDGKELLSQPKRITLARQLDVYTRYNYYMNENAAVLVGSIKLPNADKLTGRITVTGKTFNVKMEPEFAINIPLKNIENGKHQITLNVYKGAEKLVSGTAILVKREFKKGATQIDHQRRCLVVDGKPYLAIAPFFGVNRGIKVNEQEMVLKNMLRLHKEMGYRCFLVGAVDDKPIPKQTQKFLDLCAKAGIKVIYWPFLSWRHRKKITPTQRFEAMKSDSIISWLVVDEPELYAKSKDVETFMDAYRKISPYTPVFMNNTLIGIPGRFAGLKTDILMLDDYLTNRENRKVIEMIDSTYIMREAGKEERKPIFYFLAGENLHNHYRECTYAEQVAETYGVIIAGCRGASYFCSMPLYPEDYRACVDVNRELLELEEVIFSLEKTSNAAISDSVVKFITRKLGNKIFVIALNSSNDRAADVEIMLPSEFKYNSKATVKFENRTLRVKNGRITDKFKALERHVYCIELK
jgi:hypothetical protein